jgi:membrane-associated phospholipid phosphatase
MLVVNIKRTTGLTRAARAWLVTIAATFALALSTWLATQKRLVLGEEYILGFAYGLPEDLRLFFLVVTLLGSAWILTIVLILLLIKERFDIAIRVILASGTAYLLVGFAKEIVGRPRPGLLTSILQRELFVMGHGFPSAHVALATTLALIIGAYLPNKRRLIIPIWIGLVALSRLYLGVHAPLDIVGGFCIGLLAATSVLVVFPAHKAVHGIRVAKPKGKA